VILTGTGAEFSGRRATPGIRRPSRTGVEARLEVDGFGGLHVLTNRTTVEQSRDRDTIATDLDTRGLASFFVDLKSHSQVTGRLDGEAPHPESYRADVSRNGAERHYGIDFRRNGAVINASAPPSTKASSDGRKELRGALDQLTACFLIENQLTARGTCALVIPVFDGTGLYNLHSTDIGRKTLSAGDHQNFTGSSELCEVRRQDVVANPDRNEDTYQKGKIWYARLTAAGQMMAVRMEYTTEFSVVRAYLAELHSGGVDLRLTPE
jgi:Protein of unknown function (DUF3108)